MTFKDDQEVINRIASPMNSAAIQLARNQEERLLMHGEAILEKYSLPFWAFRNFTMWWQSLVTQEKHQKINQLITTPLSSVSVVEEIFQQIGKFRDAQDRYVSFDFASPDFTNDFQKFLQSQNDDSFWRENTMEALKTGINDIVVIDLPAFQKTKRPEPYQYLVSPSMFVDVDINKFNGMVEYFIFKQSKFRWDSALTNAASPGKFNFNEGTEVEKIIAIDDACYRVLIRNSNDQNAQWQVWQTSEHKLGYCPCTDFWKPSIGGTNGINKRGILTNLFSKLDKYLFYSALVDYMDIYGAFPIFVTYSMEDNEYDEKRKDVNWGDYFSPQTTSYIGTDAGVSKNPRTSYTWMGAPGSILEYQQPADANDANFVKDSPHFINMPVEALKHVNDRCRTLRNEIIQYATGENLDYMNEVAKNEQMIDASFNKQDSVLTFVKRQVERVHRFVTKAKAELRYGKEYFLSCTVDYGSDYFLKDASKVVSEYSEAVEAGMSPEYCQQIAKEAGLTRFKNNPDVLARQRILREVIPYQDYKADQLTSLGIDLGDTDNFVLRINSTNFISRFELDYGDIVKFGSTISYEDKIFFIQNKLKEYGKQLNWTRTEPAGGTKPNSTGAAG